MTWVINVVIKLVPGHKVKMTIKNRHTRSHTHTHTHTHTNTHTHTHKTKKNIFREHTTLSLWPWTEGMISSLRAFAFSE